MPFPSSELLIFILLSGISTGIAAYNVLLFYCTRHTLYLHYSAILIFGNLAYGLWNTEVNRLLWPFNTWPHKDLQFVFDSINLVLIAYFIKNFLILFVDFKKKHPILTHLLNLYGLLGVLLILSYLIFPHPLLFTTKTVIMISGCFITIASIPICYPTIKHLRTFIITVGLFVSVIGLFFTTHLLQELHYPLNFSSNTLSFFCILLLIPFSLLITTQLNHDRKQRDIAQQSAIQNLEKYQQLYEQAIEGLFSSTYNGRLLASNLALKTLFAIKPAMLANQDIFLPSYFIGADNTWNQIIRQLKQQDVVEGLEIQGLADSWYSLSARLLKTDADEIIEGSLIDISDRKKQALELIYLASHDSLTRLFNRAEFEQRLQNAIESQHNQALLFIDLDQFKVINDTCGHPAGDECLRQVAHLLQAQLATDEILARLGGDEFGLLIQASTLSSAHARADRVRQALENYHFVWRSRMFKTTASIGVLMLSPHTASVSYALSLVDSACYAAKEAGRNCVMTSNPHCEITLQRHTQMDMVATLNQALKDNQLILHHQLITPLLGNNACPPWYEILVRLRVGDTILAPGSFLPAAQRYGLLPQLDRWIIKAACAWLHDAHQQLNFGLLNINISPQTFSQPGFLRFVQNTLADYAINPMQICFEIAEYNALDDLAQSLRLFQQLRDLGIRLALDDFGSGFASFDYMKRLPVDFIKIDGQFVRDISRNVIDKTLVAAVTDIAHSLGRQVIAESIENHETSATLRSLGVDFGQGYYFHKPELLIPTKLHLTTEHTFNKARSMVTAIPL